MGLFRRSESDGGLGVVVLSRYHGYDSWYGCLVSSRRRHTRYWRDWSSDVCSSDLGVARVRATGFDDVPKGCLVGVGGIADAAGVDHQDAGGQGHLALQVGVPAQQQRQIGRASCRERVEISVVAVSFKQKIMLSRLP